MAGISHKSVGTELTQAEWEVADSHDLTTLVGANMPAVKLDDLATPDDNTDLNASTTRHGLLRKLDDNAVHYLNGKGEWKAPPRLPMLFCYYDGKVFVNPGTTYTQWSTALQRPIDLTDVTDARIIVAAQGNEAGSGKGIEIHNDTDGSSLCEYTWNGSARQNGKAGSWTSVSLSGEKVLEPYFKGSSATEDITFWAIYLQVR